ncbi:MAG: nicotinate (nicotinamide) nucleotide adenylyltransferase [Gemmatimonadales bacterium]|nr:nicotinate (nicotinamide) nucleotide adenylyltransferase [Gemmatimonadales bacterium]
MRIGVFGGSFDPVHHGHLLAALTLAEHLGLDQVRLVVAAHQPLKEGRHGASAEHRLAMVESAVRGVGVLQADRIEVDRVGPSYTVDTLRAFHRAAPSADLVLLLGADAAEELPRWREVEEVRRLARVEVFARAGAPGGTVSVPRIDISSTDIRARVRRKQSIQFWVPPAVAEYIARHRLYVAEGEDRDG